MQREIERIQKEAARKKERIEKLERDKAKDDFNLEKSRIALEKLQLNWIKWNITCLALGLTAYKFYYSRLENSTSPIGYYITGREIGMFLNSLGFITLFFATLQHRQKVKNLKLQYPTMNYSLSLRLSYVILVFSILVLLIVILRT